jgi:YgiT-type zinc finger domain-containing protein
MPESDWVDCPACGAKRSMRPLEGQSERFTPAGYSSIEISGLDGNFCETCGDGFWSRDSERRIARLLSENIAHPDE